MVPGGGRLSGSQAGDGSSTPPWVGRRYNSSDWPCRCPRVVCILTAALSDDADDDDNDNDTAALGERDDSGGEQRLFAERQRAAGVVWAQGPFGD